MDKEDQNRKQETGARKPEVWGPEPWGGGGGDRSDRMLARLAEAILALTHELCETRKQREADNKHQVILDRIVQLERRVMSVISEYNDRVIAQFTAISSAVDRLVASQVNLTNDIGGLKEIIRKLQENPGPISPEDQALLTQGEALIAGIATRTQAVADALAALDAQTETLPDGTTPPPPPTNATLSAGRASK